METKTEKKPDSDAERQRRRRQKLKAQREEAKYAPENFIAEAVCALAATGEISQQLLARIRTEAVRSATEQHPEWDVVLRKYAAKNIHDFLTAEEKSA